MAIENAMTIAVFFVVRCLSGKLVLRNSTRTSRKNTIAVPTVSIIKFFILVSIIKKPPKGNSAIIPPSRERVNPPKFLHQK